MSDMIEPGYDLETDSVVIKVTEHWVVSVARMMFNDRILLTHRTDWPIEVTAGWCYDRGLPATAAAAVFDPENERAPVGFKKLAFDSRFKLIGCGACSRQDYDEPPDCGEKLCSPIRTSM